MIDDIQLTSVVHMSLQSDLFDACPERLPKLAKCDNVSNITMVVVGTNIDGSSSKSAAKCFESNRKLAMWMAGLNWGLKGKVRSGCIFTMLSWGSDIAARVRVWTCF